MSRDLPPHTLMVTYLSDALSRRGITVEHLIDLLQPTPEMTVRSWLDGRMSPPTTVLPALAEALRLSVVELTAGWLISNEPALEQRIRRSLLDPLGSSFPRTDDFALRAPRPRPRMDVGDPHDTPHPLPAETGPSRTVRKRAAGAKPSSS